MFCVNHCHSNIFKLRTFRPPSPCWSKICTYDAFFGEIAEKFYFQQKPPPPPHNPWHAWIFFRYHVCKYCIGHLLPLCEHSSWVKLCYIGGGGQTLELCAHYNVITLHSCDTFLQKKITSIVFIHIDLCKLNAHYLQLSLIMSSNILISVVYYFLYVFVNLMWYF